MTKTTNAPFAKAEMLIRKPVPAVFEAFVNPEITTKFWFTKSTGRLEAGKQVQWTWEMYDHTENISVKTIVPNEKILIEWGINNRSWVEWNFTEFNGNTFVSITNGGFAEDAEAALSEVRDSTEGFTLVLAGLKAYFEHGIMLNLVGDRFPKGVGNAV
jgi:uncharacterized protein YndB with AHSA1/START domain